MTQSSGNNRKVRHRISGCVKRKRAANLRLQLLYPYWCPGGDSNSHAIRRYHLKIVCLPIPPPGHRCLSIKKDKLWQAFFCLRRFFLRAVLLSGRTRRFLQGVNARAAPQSLSSCPLPRRTTDAPAATERLTSSTIPSIVNKPNDFREPDGGRAANPARSERKQR